MRRLPKAATGAAVLAAGALAGSCTSAPPPDDAILVRNDTGATLLVLPLTAELATRTDPAYELDVADNEDLRVEPGMELAIAPRDVTGGFGAGDDLALFLYEVSGPTARFRNSRLVGRQELDGDDGHVTLVAADLGESP